MLVTFLALSSVKKITIETRAGNVRPHPPTENARYSCKKVNGRKWNGLHGKACKGKLLLTTEISSTHHNAVVMESMIRFQLFGCGVLFCGKQVTR